MRVPEFWLRAYCDPPQLSSAALAETLTMAGLEVEATEPAAPPFSQVVVARVLSVAPHPAADALKVCSVDAGAAAPLEIVCGAPNVAAGIHVPCALVGAELPGGMKIARAKLRGVTSDGMLCSARELGLSDDHGGLLLLPEDAPVGRPLRDYLRLDEPVHTLKLTPNRADCLSIAGVARELSALTGAPLRLPPIKPVPAALPERLPVDIQATDLCARFCGRVVRGVDARAATPAWMRERLARAGQRSISALVDISNYVMLELGRPTHVFDLDKLRGGLTVRWAKPGERVTLLNEQTIALDTDVGVIADDHGIQSLAGIMGGAATAVTLDTRNVYLEAAFWWPGAIAGRARRYGFSSDASHRFERGVDPASTAEHLEYLSTLIVAICGGQVGPMTDAEHGWPKPKPVRMRLARAAKVIGMPLSADTVGGVFNGLGFGVAREADQFIVTAPSYRFDIAIEEDLIEEVARVHGFDKLPKKPTLAPAAMLPAPSRARSTAGVKRILVERGYHEALTFSFISSALARQFDPGVEPIKLLNPIAEQLDVMRPSLAIGLVEVLRFNLNRQATRVRLFELGRVFRKDSAAPAGPLAVAGIAQPLRLAGLAWGPALPEQWGAGKRAVDFFDVKADVEALLAPCGVDTLAIADQPMLHPGQGARIIGSEGQSLGWIGVLHPSLAQALELPSAPVLFELDADAVLARAALKLDPIPKFPIVIRDMTFVISSNVSQIDVKSALTDEIAKNPALAIVRDVKLFDEYRGKGLENKEKSLAFRVRMQDTDRTLNDEQVAMAMARLVARVEAEFGAKLRDS